MDTLSPPNGTRSYHNYRDHVVKKVPENKVIISTAETDRRSSARSRTWSTVIKQFSTPFFQIMLILAYLPRSSNARDPVSGDFICLISIITCERLSDDDDPIRWQERTPANSPGVHPSRPLLVVLVSTWWRHVDSPFGAYPAGTMISSSRPLL